MTMQRQNNAVTKGDAPLMGGVLQRKCACGGTPGPTGECESCKQKREAREGVIQRSATSSSPVNEVPEIVHDVLQSPGQPLERNTREFMESRFGEDFSGVRVHTDSRAAESARAVNASAYTVGRNVVFGARQFDSTSQSGKQLIAHELAHVVQQGENSSITNLHGIAPSDSPMEREAESAANIATSGGRINPDASVALRAGTTSQSDIHRVVELRPPGRGEASAFERRQELIDRLNRQSSAVQYQLNGQVLQATVINAATLTNFDRQMQGFIGRAEVVPLRLITRAGRVGGRPGQRLQPVLIDDFDLAYLDIDDMLASSDLSFQLNLIHLLTERFGTQNYEKRIGTNIPQPEFARAHQAGIDAEVAHLQSVIGDPTIRFVYEEIQPNGTGVFGFRSLEGYRIFHVFRNGNQEVRGGSLFVQTQDGRRLTIEQLQAGRAARRVIPQGANNPTDRPNSAPVKVEGGGQNVQPQPETKTIVSQPPPVKVNPGEAKTEKPEIEKSVAVGAELEGSPKIKDKDSKLEPSAKVDFKLTIPLSAWKLGPVKLFKELEISAGTSLSQEKDDSGEKHFNFKPFVLGASLKAISLEWENILPRIGVLDVGGAVSGKAEGSVGVTSNDVPLKPKLSGAFGAEVGGEAKYKWNKDSNLSVVVEGAVGFKYEKTGGAEAEFSPFVWTVGVGIEYKFGSSPKK